MSVMNKRLLKEITALYTQQNQKPLVENDYIIHFDESNINKIHALIKAPYESVYRHKFIRLDLTIPDNYPHSPPEVQFVNHDGVRIHPNMYENGKCCSTILNTWGDSKFEKWTSSMGIETILLTFHSFLDYNPYTYEPGGRDDPSYSVYVTYQSWITCLIRYLQYEKIELFNSMIHNYMLTNVDKLFGELDSLEALYPYGEYYTRCFEVDNYIINYDKIRQTLSHMFQYIDYVDNVGDINYNDFINGEYTCNICFDTCQCDTQFKLACGHGFHTVCLRQHVYSNAGLCPMCRCEIGEMQQNEILALEQDTAGQVQEEWIVNPLTKRRVKVGGRTWQYLVETGVIQST